MKKLFAMMMGLLMMMMATASAEGMTPIQLSDGKIQAEGAGIQTEGSTVTISQPGDYLLSGSLSNGQIRVDCKEAGKVTLFLNGVNVHNGTGPAIWIGECAPRAVISLVESTENRLSDGTELVFTDVDEPDGVIFSRSDLTVSGNGSLEVQAGAMNGIVSKDDLKIEGGKIRVTVPNHGIKGKDFVEISGGELTIQAGRDGIKSTNKKDPDRGYVAISGGNIHITCGDDALSFESRLSVTGGSVDVQKTAE